MVAITASDTAHHLPTRRRPAPSRRGLEAVPAPGARIPARLAAVVVTALLAVAVVGALAYLVTSPAATPGTGAAPTLDAHVVAEGETMWSIAGDIAPAGEAATYVERLVAANGGADVAAGQVLTVPVP